MKLNERVYLVGSGASGFSLTDAKDCHIYLLDGGTEAALIDAGGGRDVEGVLRIIDSHGIPRERIRYLLVTHKHADHTGGAAALREALDLQVLASQEIAGFLRTGDEEGIALRAAREAGMYPPDFRFEACPVDRELAEGQEVSVGDLTVRVLETPGHSAGHLAFLVDADGQQTLFSGDILFHGGRILLLNTPDCDLQAYIRTLRKLGGLAVDVFLPGHEAFSLEDGQRHIDVAVEYLDRLRIPASRM